MTLFKFLTCWAPNMRLFKRLRISTMSGLKEWGAASRLYKMHWQMLLFLWLVGRTLSHGLSKRFRLPTCYSCKTFVALFLSGTVCWLLAARRANKSGAGIFLKKVGWFVVSFSRDRGV